MSKCRPFEQGELDGLCGIYSIVNAVRLIRGEMTNDERRELFLEILNKLSCYHNSLSFISDGISITAIAGILRDIVEPKYGINRIRPFDKRPDVSLNEFWDYIYSFMESDQKSAVLIGLGGIHDHWTIVESISDKRINVMDSDGLVHFNRSACTTGARTTYRRKHQLIPTHTYFLS